MFSFKEIITKKKLGQELTNAELQWLIDSFLNGSIPDYQMATFLAAIYFKGMNTQEIVNLTKIYVNSGKTYDLSSIKGWKADKHSTGGIGDKITLVFAPLVAFYGIKVAKLSGRALGETGGTIDKLESVPGWKGELSETEFQKNVQEIGMSIITTGQKIVPADKKIYALRDAIQMVDSIPLIAASVMAKKLVIDADSLILDVKVGSGAFMKDLKTATELSKIMVEIGKHHNRHVVALLTDMNKPLGRTIGNALEIKEAYETLNGQGPKDVEELSVFAAATTLVQAGLFKDLNAAQNSVLTTLKSGKASHYLVDMITAQGGDWSVIENYNRHFQTKHKIVVLAKSTGYVKYIDTQKLGFLAIGLGAGRKLKTDQIDHAAGIYLNKTAGEKVEVGQPIMTLLTNYAPNANWEKLVQETFTIVDQPFPIEIIKKIIK